MIGPAIALAVVATYFAAARPARSITRIPLVAALSGRPAPPKQVHRSVIPGVILLAVAVVCFWFTGKSAGGGGGGALELVLGFVTLIVAVILLSPFCLVLLARLGRQAPIAVRLALRDLVRYRARSGSALAAISLGVLIAALVCVLTAQRYGNVLDYAGPNLASNQIIVYTPNGGPGGGPGNGPGNGPGGSSTQDKQHAAVRGGGRPQHRQGPRLGHRHRTRPDQRVAGPPRARAVLVRAGVRGHAPAAAGLRDQGRQPRRGRPHRPPRAVRRRRRIAARRPPATRAAARPGQCLQHPVIQEVGALPAGTSAPNTVITEHAIRTLGLGTSLSPQGWLIQAPHPPTAAQITNARLAASVAGMSIETKNSAPSSAEILDWATVFGIALALGILAMSIGLIRSETARDLRTLAATGASGVTRRTITATTAFALALCGAVAGTAAAYVAAIAYAFDNQLDGLSELSNVPTTNLLIILVAMPIAAGLGGWLLAGRQPAVISRQPLE